jgi:pilus assembly protein CpaC
VTHISISGKAFGGSKDVSMGMNKSVIVDLPADAQEVIVSQPAVANAIMRTKRRAVLQSVGSGDTNIFFLDAQGRTIVVLDVSVKGAVSNVAAALRDTYAKVLPDRQDRGGVGGPGQCRGQQRQPHRAVGPYANTEDDVQKAVAIAGQFAGSPENVASVITVGGPQQVMLKVTVAEVNRQVAKTLGINLGASYSAGNITTELLSTQPIGGVSNIFTSNGFKAGVDVGGLSIDAYIRALEQQRAVRTLAEPTLTAMSGQPAEFVAGGQFAVPTDVDAEGRVSYSYKDFGVRLGFTPTIKSAGTIGLLIDTSVSELSAEGSITVGATTLPGIKNRQAKTSVELGVGQTLAIGGLIQDSIRSEIDRLPGLGDLPILGALFRSRDYIHAQTELVVLVTPYYAKATMQQPELPTDKLQFASDAEAIFLGHLENIYGVGPAGMRGSYNGSVGFLLD